MDILNKIKKNKNKNKELIKILNKNKKYTIKLNNDSLKIITPQNIKILVSEYIFYGIYESMKKLWIWSNSIPGVNKKYFDIINKIKNKSFMFENSNDKQMIFIYQFLTNNVIEIYDESLLDIINDVLLYLSDNEIILTPLNTFGNKQYIGLTKIIEKYY